MRAVTFTRVSCEMYSLGLKARSHWRWSHTVDKMLPSTFCRRRLRRQCERDFSIQDSYRPQPRKRYRPIHLQLSIQSSTRIEDNLQAVVDEFLLGYSTV